jgi:hypothetical protein
MLDRRRVLIWSLISIVAATSTTIAIESAEPKLAAAQLLGSSSSPAAIVTQDNSSERVEAELITLKRTGFEPREINRPAGRFILVVHNRSGLEEMSLDLVRENGERIKSVRVHRKKLDWKEVITLPPGVYLLRELNNPEWTCRINITAR